MKPRQLTSFQCLCLTVLLEDPTLLESNNHLHPNPYLQFTLFPKKTNRCFRKCPLSDWSQSNNLSLSLNFNPKISSILSKLGTILLHRLQRQAILYTVTAQRLTCLTRRSLQTSKNILVMEVSDHFHTSASNIEP